MPLGTAAVRYQVVAVNRSGRLSRRSRSVTVLPEPLAPARALLTRPSRRPPPRRPRSTWGKSKAAHARVASYRISQRRAHRAQRQAHAACASPGSAARAHAGLPRRGDRLARLGLQALGSDHRDHRAHAAACTGRAVGHGGQRHDAVARMEPPEAAQGLEAARLPRAARRPRRLAGRGQERHRVQPRRQVDARLVGRRPSTAAATRPRRRRSRASLQQDPPPTRASRTPSCSPRRTRRSRRSAPTTCRSAWSIRRSSTATSARERSRAPTTG